MSSEPDAERQEDPAAGESTGAAAAGESTGAYAALQALRADPTKRRLALVVAAAVGLLATSVHWLGLVVGGVLVGLASARLRWAVAGALAFGVLVLVAFVLLSPAMSAGELLALRPPVYVAVAAALVLPLLGSLVRGVV